MTNQIQRTIEVAPILEKIKKSGCKFASFTYTAKGTGEVSKVLVSLGISYENAKKTDLNKINNFTPNSPTQETAKSQLIGSLVAPDQTRSEAQQDAKISIVPGILNFYPETGNFIIFGMVIKKEVVEIGEYKKINSRPLTVEKNRIKKELNFRTAKFRNYILENVKNFSIQGQTLLIE
jgi:hypothetical protein